MQTETLGAIANNRRFFSKRRFRQIVGKLRSAFWSRLYGMKTNAPRKRLMPGGSDSGNLAALRAVRDKLQRFGPPIVVFNKSHSGSRLLARLLAEAGIFMGCAPE
jgi:hypothetical protein